MRGDFPVENVREKGRGWGGWGHREVGGGQEKEPASQCARICQNYPLARRERTWAIAI